MANQGHEIIHGLNDTDNHTPCTAEEFNIMLIGDGFVLPSGQFFELEPSGNILRPKASGVIIRFGNESSYTEFDTDGTMRHVGDATVWDDIVSSLVGRRLHSTVGTVDYDYDEVAISFAPNGSITTANDLVVWAQQLPHKSKIASVLRPHIHFEQTSTDNIEFTLRYRIQDKGGTKTTAWTDITADVTNDSVFTYTAGTLNQILSFPTIDMTGYAMSSTVQFKLTRTDSNSGAILATFIDCHSEFDMGGSSQEFVK